MSRYSRFALLPLLLVSAVAAPVAAQDEAAFRKFFEGRRVTLKIDMPGTSDGVDVRPDRPFDAGRQTDRLQRYGVSIRQGDQATVTLVKVKKDLIEFHLDGGGFGTFGDDTSTTVDMPLVQKSNRELDLEKLVKRETDSARRRTLQRELDDLKNARERENRRITAEKAVAEEQKRNQVAARRLAGGSRFNIRFANAVPGALRPQDVQDALGEYVDFSNTTASAREPAAPPPADGMPRKGMLRADAERLFGRPVTSTERSEGTLRVVTLVFVRGDQRITAEFVEGVLIRYSVTSK